MVAAFREYQVHRTGPYCYRYVGGPADGLRICHEKRGSRKLMGWHFGARDGSWMAYYTWSDEQRAYVFLEWEAINRNTHPGERAGHRR